MIKFNDVVKIKRECLGLTQTEFGTKVGVCNATISAFESGNDVSELIRKTIKYVINELEHGLEGDKLARYKLLVAARLACLETDERALDEKLDNVMFSALRWRKAMREEKRNY